MKMANVGLCASVLVVTTMISLAAQRAMAQEGVPFLINYQGDLTSPSTGEPVADGSYNMLFRIYDIESDGAPLWEGTHTDTNGNPVQVTRGILSVILGSGAGNELSSLIFNGADRWLEIQVGAETLLPRQRITSVAYSIASENSRLLGGNELSDFVIQAQGLRLQPNATSPNLIGGHQDNTVTDGVAGATVGGGGTGSSPNSVTDNFGTVGGGEDNQAGDDAGMATDAMYATVGGGQQNTAGESCATVGGGYSNEASGNCATVAGGCNSTASGDRATVGGGYSNEASGNYATVAGGWSNQATASYATIAGGGPSDPNDPSTTRNLVTDDYGTIGGGGYNQAGDNAGTTTDAWYATVGGGLRNTATDSYATVGGGYSNEASGESATLGGGEGNSASGEVATVGGGYGNTASGLSATVGGGSHNVASDNATVGGGWTNTASGSSATVGGGDYNTASGSSATVGGGEGNTASGPLATVGGGYHNTASVNFATVGGGEGNTASGSYATVGGGFGNAASEWYATVPGGDSNTAEGDRSFAAGRRANAVHHGAFVWADSNDFDFASTANNEFSARATGGARFVSAIDASGNPTAGVQLASGGGSWSSISDRALKENFIAVNGKEVLAKLAAVPISAWNYKAQEGSIRHMGPMAQDLYAAFGLGEDDKHISTVDADGVGLAAIQGLHELLREKDAEIAEIKKQNSDLQQRLSALEKLFEKFGQER